MVALNLDWFEPATQNLGNLPASLDRLICIEESKLQFARCLRAALCNPVPHGPDRLTAFLQDVRLLQQTLQHRLGILAIDRPQAWFRHSPTQERGPFAVAVFEEPIFSRFDESRAVAIRHLLPELWRKRQASCLEFDPAVSIWGRLLQLNFRLAQLNQLASPFSDVHLDELPEALPDELLTPALQGFAAQLAQRIKTCQKELDLCYEQLWARSESFLYALHIQHLSEKARQHQGASSKHSHEGPRHNTPPPPMDRRLPLHVRDALRFMSFGELPNFEDLRSRYRIMAHKYHPDRGGSEDRFKALTQHYKLLLQHLQTS